MRAYQTLIDRLAKAMIFPKLHILDNECSQDFKQKIESNGMKYQLVPPNDHRRNIAEKAIQTFKDHFVSILCGTDKTFPLHLWDLLLQQAEHTLNLLRPSHRTPTVSDFAICGDNTISMQTPLPLLDARSKHTWPPPSEKHGHPTQPADSTWAIHGSIIAAIQSTSPTQNTQEHATPFSSSINI